MGYMFHRNIDGPNQLVLGGAPGRDCGVEGGAFPRLPCSGVPGSGGDLLKGDDPTAQSCTPPEYLKERLLG